MNKEMCTDFEIVAANHHDGARAYLVARLWTAGQRHRHFQVVANDWGAALTPIATNVLLDGPARPPGISALRFRGTEIRPKGQVRYLLRGRWKCH